MKNVTRTLKFKNSKNSPQRIKSTKFLKCWKTKFDNSYSLKLSKLFGI